ncbi:hypothetical protein DPMN_099362 [Dreissena polymorpha]|uniref:Uncharacterized protein n=1 Tax=Dreissena polymorpha TaxID=45954 RepID=A0A9D4R764_DREPO|nr:hypothetical protein DPMN_099362 [Dreissena polymorpha]
MKGCVSSGSVQLVSRGARSSVLGSPKGSVWQEEDTVVNTTGVRSEDFGGTFSGSLKSETSNFTIGPY